MNTYLVLCSYNEVDSDGVLSPVEVRGVWVEADTKQHAAREASNWLDSDIPYIVNKHIVHVLCKEDWGNNKYFPVVGYYPDSFDVKLAEAQAEMQANAAKPKYPRKQP